MKLIVRSQYWGNVLRGKPKADSANPTRSFRTISAQAVLTIEGKYWGCCQGQGKRVLEMTERHFTDTYNGDWDLYLISSVASNSEAIHTFILMPEVQLSIDTAYHIYHSGWQFFGKVAASSIRQNLSDLLKDTFKPNETIGYRYHHVHIDILMHQVVDYAARAKKQLNAQSEVDTATTVSNSDAEEVNKPNPVPPLVQSNSQDASSVTGTSSSPLTCTSYQEVPKFVPSGSYDQDMVCYPVAMSYPGAQHIQPMYPTYGYPIMNPGMHMVPMPHAGLAPYLQAHPVNGMATWPLLPEQQSPPAKKWEQSPQQQR